MSDNSARQVYDNFRIKQPHIEEKGLWKSQNGIFHIHCPTLDDMSKTIDGINLVSWFNNSCRPVCSRIDLRAKIPQGSVEIPKRSLDEIVFQSGASRTIDDVYYELQLELPHDFPEFALVNMPPKVILVTENDLSQSHIQEFEIVKKNLGFSFNLENSVDPTYIKRQNKEQTNTKRNQLQLITSKALSRSTLSTRLKNIYEEDENLWLTERKELLTGSDLQKDYLPKEWRKDKYKCLVPSTAFQPDDIRTYLSINDVVIYQMPLGTSETEFLKSSGLDRKDFLKLFEMERIKVVLPHSIERYPLSFTEELTELNAKSLLLPRRMSCQNIVELRSRVPLLIPPLNYDERRAILAQLYEASKLVDDDNLKRFLLFMVSDLSRIWTQVEYRLNKQGPTSSTSLGLGFIASELFKKKGMPDLSLEFATTASDVEWSFVLGSDLIPIDTGEYSNAAHASLLLSMYDEIPRQAPHLHDRTKTIASNILSISNRVPILDFVDVLRDGDLSRFRKYVLEKAHSGESDEELRESISKLNSEIQLFEKGNKVWDVIDLVGLEGISAASGIPGLGIITKSLEVISRTQTPNNEYFGTAMDTLKSIRTLQRNHVPLIARIKKGIWEKRN